MSEQKASERLTEIFGTESWCIIYRAEDGTSRFVKAEKLDILEKDSK